jgi:tetratricopeptide (TPR) repeat protein
VTRARAAWLAAAAAVVLYLPALGNGFALDDGSIVERNPTAHSVGAALRAFNQSYWPQENAAGQWRPLVILSFAADFEISGGSPAWLHAANTLWHAAATALLVLVLAAYVPAAAALAGGLLFAAHPVHVEAVANLVGRAEMMAAFFLFLALLIGRAIRRRAAEGRPTWPAEMALLAAVAGGLLSKEHAAVAVALLALDDLAGHDRARIALPKRDYAAVVALTLLWFVIRRGIDAGQSFTTVAPTFFGLDATGRISTMLPVVFVMIRLLVWPWDLFPDYHPQVVPRLEHPTALGGAGLVLLLALAALAVVAWRRHRALSVGLFVVAIAWLPTANLLFPTGIVIAERTLYLASAGAALIGAAGFEWLALRRGAQLAAGVTAIVLVAFGVRTVLQIPVWRSNRDLVLWALNVHPESYREHQAAARALVRMGDGPEALRQYAVSIELYPLDHYNLAEAASAALDAGRPRLALGYLRRAERLDRALGLTQQLLSRALLTVDSASEALAHARRAAAAEPRQAEAARMVAASFLALGERDSALDVWPQFRRRGGSFFEGWLLEASTLAAAAQPERARAALDSAARWVPPDAASRSRLRDVQALVERAEHP